MPTFNVLYHITHCPSGEHRTEHLTVRGEKWQDPAMQLRIRYRICDTWSAAWRIDRIERQRKKPKPTQKRFLSEADLRKRIALAQKRQTEWLTKLKTVTGRLDAWRKEERKHVARLDQLMTARAVEAEARATAAATQAAKATRFIDLEGDEQ